MPKLPSTRNSRPDFPYLQQLVKRVDERYRLLALIRDRFTCQRCSKTYDLTVHHCIPRRQKGSRNQPWNLITICDECHKYVERYKDKEFLNRAKNIALRRKPKKEYEWFACSGLGLYERLKLKADFIEKELIALAATW